VGGGLLLYLLAFSLIANLPDKAPPNGRSLSPPPSLLCGDPPLENHGRERSPASVGLCCGACTPPLRSPPPCILSAADRQRKRERWRERKREKETERGREEDERRISHPPSRAPTSSLCAHATVGARGAAFSYERGNPAERGCLHPTVVPGGHRALRTLLLPPPPRVPSWLPPSFFSSSLLLSSLELSDTQSL